MSLPSGHRKLRCLFSAVCLCLFNGPLAADLIASDEPASPHHHERSAATRHESVYETLPASGLSPEEDLEYSRFMHHSSGVTVLVIATLLLGDRLTAHRHRLLRVGSGLAWLLFGIFLCVFSDLEAWPIGPAGFIESFSLSTTHEWIQHHLLSMIPMVLGIYTMLYHWREPRPLWN